MTDGPSEIRSLAATFNQTAARLEHLLASQRAFAGEASHQLKTPLAALRLRLDNLEPAVAPFGRESLTAALTETDRLARLVEGLFTMAGLEEKSATRDVVDPQRVCAERHQTWAPVFEQRNVLLALTGERTGPVLVLPGALEQILDNLLSKALRHSPPGSTVTVHLHGRRASERRRAAADGRTSFVDLHVIDQGTGLTEEQRLRAFDRFWRAPDAPKGGTGLGLALVQRLAHAGGGNIALRAAPQGGLDGVVGLPCAGPACPGSGHFPVPPGARRAGGRRISLPAVPATEDESAPARTRRVAFGSGRVAESVVLVFVLIPRLLRVLADDPAGEGVDEGLEVTATVLGLHLPHGPPAVLLVQLHLDHTGTGAAVGDDPGGLDGVDRPRSEPGVQLRVELDLEAGGRGTDGLKAENTWEHNAGEIAEALASAYEECGADLVVLVGDPRERPAVHEKLPEAVREVTVETEHGGRAAGSSSPVLEEAIERARRQYTRHRLDEALDRFRAGRVGTDRPTDAVEGVPALVEAAREHRIDTLLIRPDGPELGRETWVGDEPDQLAVRRTDARSLGEDAPIPVRADDALLRSAAVTAADVLILPPSDDDGPDVPAGGLGALLRWTYEPTPA